MKNLLFSFLIIFTFSCSKDTASEIEPEKEAGLNIVGTWESDIVFSVTQKPGNAVLNSTLNSPDGSLVVFDADGNFTMTKFSIREYGFDSFKAGTIKGVYEIEGDKVKLTSSASVINYFTAKITNVTVLELGLSKELLLQALEETKDKITAESYKKQSDFISVYAFYKQEATFTKK